MKNKNGIVVIALMALTGGVRADVLVGWDFEQPDGDRDHPSYVSGAVSTNGTLAGFTFNSGNGSADGTWGNSTATPAPGNLLGNSTKFRGGDSSLIQDLTILVKDGAEVTLSSLNFDYLIPFNKSPRDLTVSYLSGDLGAGGIALYSFADSGKVETMTGVDVDLTTSAMTDLNLTGGQSATFRFDFTDADKTGASFVDNIGILGTVDVIPEPGTLGLMAFFGSAVLFLRRRMMQ